MEGQGASGMQQPWVVHQVRLPGIFYGGSGPDLTRGLFTKHRVAAERKAALQNPSTWADGKEVRFAEASRAASKEEELKKMRPDLPRGTRCYTSAPNQQSIMDSMIFNRVFDWRSSEQHEQAFRKMYGNAAGQLSAGITPNEKRIKYSVPRSERPKSFGAGHRMAVMAATK
mmetsp:Transcript_13127/g.22771  ORF Transcript_13127/g.22771 Transcript_13127/m.22771 type:complete len:171 (-) Transcript_13127:104-616(-)